MSKNCQDNKCKRSSQSTIIINLRVAAYEHTNVVGERFWRDLSIIIRKVLSVILTKFEVCPSQYGSRWLIAGHGMHFFMPGILEPYPNQSDECMHRRRFKEGDDPDARKDVQHWNN